MQQTIRAPEFPKNLTWLNSTTPLSLAQLRGHVVILDFWTYCCINCIHILPDLKYLERKYAAQPVMVIGVHAAKFANERDSRNIEAAIERYEIEHPVVVDNKHEVWDHYAIGSWPSFIVIDAEGYVRGKASGEGLREALDDFIENLLEEGRAKGVLAREPLRVLPERKASKNALSFPGKITMDSAGERLFIADSNHNRILVCDMESPTSARIRHIVGTGEIGHADGSFDTAAFHHPQGLCFVDERLYVCDTENHLIREVDLESESVLTIAGTGQQAHGSVQEGAGLEVSLNSPWDIVHREDYLYVAMAGSHQIHRYHLDSGRMELFAGNGRENIVDEDRLDAQLAQPSGLSLADDKLYFADSEVSAVRFVDFETDRVETLIGSGLFSFGHVDGPLARARLQHCLGLFATDTSIYVADTYNHAIRRIDLEAGKIETLLMRKSEGACQIGDVECQMLTLFEPNDVWLHGGYLYIADTNNHLIRALDFETAALVDVEILE